MGKRNFILAVVAVSSLAMAAYGRSGRIVPSNNIISEEMALSVPFDGINLGGSMTVVYNDGNETKVVIDAPDNVMPLVGVEVVDNVLNINYKNKVRFSVTPEVTVYVTAPEVTRYVVASSGEIDVASDLNIKDKEVMFAVVASGDIEAKNVKCAKFAGSVSASGDINVKLIDASDVAAVVSGSGEMNVGTVNGTTVSCSVSGPGDIEVKQVNASDAAAIVSGSGDINIGNVNSATLSCSVVGSGDLNVKQVNANEANATISGSGDISINGKSGVANLSITGSADIDADGLVSDNVVVQIVGSGTVDCHAVKKLDVTVTGSGVVKYKGSPSVNANRAGCVHRM